MPNKMKIIILIVAILAVILLIASLVWGKTIRMAKANQLLTKSQVDKAKAIYEDLAVDLPKSPYVLHNVGLSYFKQGENDRAVEYFKNSIKEFDSLKQNPIRKKNALNLDYYHLGGAQFQSAAKNSQESGANLYQEALDNFKKAIENNPQDMDAKYNYELAKLRLQQSQNQDQNQEQKQKQDQKENKNDNKNENKNQNKDENKNANQAKPSPAPKPTDNQNNQMSKEEVEALLKMNQNNDQYQAPIIKNNNQSPEKDW